MSKQARWPVAMVVATTAFAAQSRAYAQVEEDLKDGDRYFEQGQLGKAAKKYDHAINRFPRQVPPEAYGKRAAIFIITKEYEEGLRFVTQKAELAWPNAAEIQEQKALIYWGLGSKPDAIQIAEKVVSERPGAFGNQKIIGDFYYVRNPERAIRGYEAYLRHRLESLEEGDVLPRVKLGFAYLRQGRHLRERGSSESREFFAKAEKQFDLLLRRYGKRAHVDVNSQTGLCAAYTALGKYDRAITVCEKTAANPHKIDRMGSVWYNLGQAYLAKRQPKRARAAANEFIRVRRRESRGYLLLGDSYLQERNWARALDEYLKAESFSKNDQTLAADLGVKLGIAYQRLNRPKEAIVKLEAAYEIDQVNSDLIRELGTAYLADRQDERAVVTVENLIKRDSFRSLSRSEQTNLLVISANGLYNQNKLSEARRRLERAHELNSNDVKIQIALIQTINYQAYDSLQRGDAASAERHLLAARELDEQSHLTNQNLAILALDRGQCDKAKGYLEPLATSPGYALMYHRLMGRAFLCQRKPDREMASKHYARAEKESLNPNLQANLVRAEVYAEWALLLANDNIEDALDKLETALQFAAGAPEVARAIRRNRALVLFQRGWVNLRGGKIPQAVEDFEIANREPALLKGNEPQAFTFSEAVARLLKGDAEAAEKLFAQLRASGKQGEYLKPPYHLLGPRFFAAYAKHRSQDPRLHREAATDFTGLLSSVGRRSTLGRQLRALIVSSWTMVAEDAYRIRDYKQAAAALRRAARLADSDEEKRTVAHNRYVLQMGMNRHSAAMRGFRQMGGNPPEALANLGILLDMQGRSRDAYDSWLAAVSRGLKSWQVHRWIDAKKRFFGF